MNAIAAGPIRQAILCCAVAVCLTCGPTTAQTTRPAAKKAASGADSSFKRYYGFREMEILKLQWGLGVPIVSDINGDGRNDLVVVNNRKARIEILLQKKDFDPARSAAAPILDDDVNDIFGREAAWRFVRRQFDLDVAATSAVVADLNADGRPDLAYGAKEGLYVALQQAPKKDAGPAKPGAPREPAWAAPRRIDIRNGLQRPDALTAGDLNGDGRTDLALLTADGTAVLLQNDDGTLAQPAKHYTSAKQLSKLRIADLDANKRADLVLLTGEREFPLRVRFQTRDGKLGPEVRLQLTGPTVLETVALAGRACLATISDHSKRVQLWALAPQASKRAYPVFTYPLPASEAAKERDVVAADVNGDGLKDAVVSNPAAGEFLLFLAGKDGSLASPKTFPGMTDMRKLCAADLDGRGREAIVALSVKEKLIGVTRLEQGRLVFPRPLPIRDEPLAMDVADVNADGKPDLLYVARRKKEDKYFLRTILDLNQPKDGGASEIELTELKDRPLGLRAADIDHDGRIDAMILRPYGSLLLVRQGPKGTWRQNTKSDIQAGLVANVFPAALSLAPLGPKGATAILVARKRFARALVFDAVKGWRVVDQYQAAGPQGVLSAAAACRLPGEKELTLLTYDASRRRMGVLKRGQDGTYRTDRELKVGSLSIRKILTGNFGGPSKLSVLLCGRRKIIRVPLIGRTFHLQKIASFEPDIKGGRYGALTVGDVNNDGGPDVILCEQNKRHIEILTFNPAARLISAMRFKVFEQYRNVERSRYGSSTEAVREPRAAVLGDVTADGKADLILLVHDRIIIYPQD